jgi:hypothetical protein
MTNKAPFRKVSFEQSELLNQRAWFCLKQFLREYLVVATC